MAEPQRAKMSPRQDRAAPKPREAQPFSRRNERPKPTRTRPVVRPALGQPFDPQHETCGFYPPDIVGRQTDLTDGQKRLYERGVRWAGRNGMFWYSFETMAV